MLAMPVAIQWPMNVAQALLWVEGFGCSREACSALSCSYCTRAVTRCLTALSMRGALRIVRAVLGVVRHVHSGARLVDLE